MFSTNEIITKFNNIVCTLLMNDLHEIDIYLLIFYRIMVVCYRFQFSALIVNVRPTFVDPNFDLTYFITKKVCTNSFRH